MKTEQIGGVWFKVVSEYEQKFLLFNDARLTWKDAQALYMFIISADAEKYVEPVVVKPKEPEAPKTYNVELKKRAPALIELKPAAKPKKK